MRSDWIPDSYQSSRVLNAIRARAAPSSADVPEPYRNRIEQIGSEYEAELGTLGPRYEPRNLPFYRIIRRTYPRFRWVEVGRQTDVETYFRGRKPSLLAYLLEMIPPGEVAPTARMSRASADDRTIEAMAQYLPALQKLGICAPSEQDIARLNRWLAQARTGAAMTIVSPVCPDYSAGAGEERKYRFTFRSLGTGCGLAGMRLLESIEGLHLLLRELGAENFVHHVCVGDFEAFSEANLKRVGLTCEAFLERNRLTAEALAGASPVPIQASLFTDHCGGRQGWTACHDKMIDRFEADAFGRLRDQDFVHQAAEARRELYRRWFGDSVSEPDFLIGTVLRQGAEYSAMAEVIAEHFANPLIVGADHHRMAPFYNLGREMPVLYLDRNYE